MHKVFAIVALLSALPFFVSAQAGLPAQAGFPDKPLWLSNIRPASGEGISLSTVLYNGTTAKAEGTLTFLIDDTKLTSQNVSLAAQSSSVVSAKWVAVAGTHSFSARFATASGTATAVQQQTSAIQITVAEPPPPSALEQNVGKAATVAGQFASSSAPFVQKVAQAVFTQTEAVRNAGINYLEKKVDAPAAKKADPKDTSNTTGFSSTTSPDASNTAGSTLHNIGQAALAASLFTMRSFYLFYPILALIFLFALYWAARKIRRPHY